VNDSLGLEFFSVETFKIFGKVTDLSDSPSYTFTPNSVARISATVKDSSNNPIESLDVSATINYPNRTSQTVTLTGGNGTFSYDLNLAGATMGEYGVKISATYSSDTQEFSTGFSIKSISAEMMAINTELIGEAEGPSAFVTAFAPNKNATFLVALSDISKGGLFAGGPESEGLIDIDNSSTVEDECNSSVSVVRIEDDRGVEITQNVNYLSMNLTNFFNFIGGLPEGENDPSAGMLRQCMLVFAAPERTGIYRIKVKVTHGSDNYAGTTFGVQKFYATANPVDFTGEKDFWFYAPNSTINIKLKVTDLTTRQELNSSNITDASILEMFREWPSYLDMLTENYRPNITIANGVISFTTPDSEGFFDFRFKFKTNLGEEGIGTGFFMLKKYMIWGGVECEQEFGGPCMSAPGQNVSIKVKVIEIDKASKLDQGITDVSEIGTCSDCDGLVVSVNTMWNDQLMKEISSSYYSVINGTVMSSVAYLNITPGPSMPTGFFGVDLILTDPTDATKQYFGWANFEIRRLMIINDGVVEDEYGNLSRTEKGSTYGKGASVLFGVRAMDPASPGDNLNILGFNLETVRWSAGSGGEKGEPVYLQRVTDYNYTYLGKKNVSVDSNDPSKKETMNVVRITNLTKTGAIQVNFRVNTSIGSDVWSYWFEMSDYQLTLNYRGMDSSNPTFAPGESVMINISAKNFDDSGHPLIVNGTRLKMVNDMKTGNPRKLNYSVDCIDGTFDDCNTLNLTFGLNVLSSGDYFARLAINDTEGMVSEREIYFTVRGLIVTVPNIENIWIGYTDSPELELNLNNAGDRCVNERWLANDEYMMDSSKSIQIENNVSIGMGEDGCASEPNKVCVFDGEQSVLNFTLSEKIGSEWYFTGLCILDNGEQTPAQLPCSGRYVWGVGNTTHLWFNTSNVNIFEANGVISMEGISPNVTGDTVYTGNRYLIIVSAFEQQPGCGGTCYMVNVLDTNSMQIGLCNITAPDNNCTNTETNKAWVGVYIQIPRRDPSMFARHFCALFDGNLSEDTVFDGSNYNSVFCNVSNGEMDYYIVSNKTHLWYNYSTVLSDQPVTTGDTMTFNGRAWKLFDVNKNSNGDEEDGYFRIVRPDTFNKVGIRRGENIENITVVSKYAKTYGNVFCINNKGEWQDTQESCNEVQAYVVSNTSHLWVNDTEDLSPTVPNDGTFTFDLANKTWTILSVQNQGFKVRHADNKICGEKTCENNICTGYTLVSPGSYNTTYHGYIRNLINDESIGNPDRFGSPFDWTRDVYLFHNTSHVWMSNSTDFVGVPNATVGGTISDPYGGLWKVITINKDRVTLEGLNVLASTGAFINTTLSKSGNIRIELIRESNLGGWNRQQQQQQGMDLTGNELTNDSFYLAVIDSNSPSVYDTLYFSLDNNFSNPISINDDRVTRTFGNNDKLTLLNIISYSGVQVKAYSNKPSEWAELGELKIGSNVTVPVMVQSPDGSLAVANVSIRTVRKEIANSPTQFAALSPAPNKTVYGIDEIVFNLSDLGHSNSGSYALQIVAKNETEEKLEEWKWPAVTMRSFLGDTSVGEGKYVGPFYPLPLYRYDWENSKIDILQSDRRNSSNIVDGVLITAWQTENGGCEAPSFCDDWNNCSLMRNWDEQPQAYYLYSVGDSKLYRNETSCNFTGDEPWYQEGNWTLISRQGKTYNLTLLKVVQSGCQNCFSADFGIPGIDSSIIKPFRNDTNNLEWGVQWGYISNVTIPPAGDTTYDLILAGDDIDYPMCDVQESLWGMSECAKKVWFSTNRNFSDAAGYLIGQNFLSDLYLARVGSGSWDGIIIGNFSEINSWPTLPGIEVRVKDSTPSYIAKLDESELNLDLNKNGNKNDVFYVVTYDRKEDGIQSLTSYLLDDDMNITENWWVNPSLNESSPGYAKDFYGDEGGNIREINGELPKGVRTERIRFNESTGNDMPDELRPEWDVAKYNDTHMLLMKNKWRFYSNENITLVIKVYEFNHSGIPNVNITVEKVLKFSTFGSKVLSNSTEYSITGQTTTDQYGYAIVNLENSTWSNGEYDVKIRMTAPGNRIERNDYWFRVGW
jgi:hypothetical protein